MKKTNLRYAMLLALGMGWSNLASAVGLGPIQVSSYYGQPLDATIHIEGVKHPEQVVIRLAGHEAYATRGIKRQPSHEHLRFQLKKNKKGKHYIAVSSQKGIADPMLNFLITVNSGGQVITREYSVFLDPDPAQAAGLGKQKTYEYSANDYRDAEAVAGLNTNVPHKGQVGSASAVPVKKGQMPASQGIHIGGQAPVTVAVGSASPTPSSISGTTYGPVKAGETMYSIANAARPAHVDVKTMIRAIQRANPHAFANRNPSSLKVGAVLTIPQEINASPKPAAPAVEKSKGAQKKNKNGKKTAPVTHSEEHVMQEALASTEQATTKVVEAVAEKAPVQESTPPSTQEIPVSSGTAATSTIAMLNQQEALPPPVEPPPAEEKAVEVPAETPVETVPVVEVQAPVEETVAQVPEAPAPEPVVEVKVEEKPAPVVELTPPPTPKVETPAPSQTAVVYNQSHVHHDHEHNEEAAPWWMLAAAGTAGAALLGGAAYLLWARRKDPYEEEALEEMSEEEAERILAEAEEAMPAEDEITRLPKEEMVFEEDLEPYADQYNLDGLSEALDTPKTASWDKTPEDEINLSEIFIDDEEIQQMGLSSNHHVAAAPQTIDEHEFIDVIFEEQHDNFGVAVDLEPIAPMQQPAHNVSIPARHLSFDDFEGIEVSLGDWEEESETLLSDTQDEALLNISDFGLEEGFDLDLDSNASSVTEALADFVEPALSVEAEPVNIMTEAVVEAVAEQPEVLETVTAVIKEPSALSRAVQIAEQADAEAMEINLDLATSFLATGNGARAKDWLMEVLSKGSAEQKARAQELLDSIDKV